MEQDHLISARGDRTVLWLGPVVLIGLAIWISTWTGTNGASAFGSVVFVLLDAVPRALGWLAAAVGFGWPLRLALAGECQSKGWLQIVLGVSALLVIDAALGALGLLQIGGALGAWGILLIGWALFVVCVWREQDTFRHVNRDLWRAFWLAGPAIAVALIAACSAPGWLWDTEFGGYDALSYHLQLPKQWLAIGAIQPLEHNVYSALPGYTESAFYHLAITRGDAVAAAYECQFLHLIFAILTAFAGGQFAMRAIGRLGGTACFVALLATPWIIVVGTLAYNEMTVTLMLVGGLIVLIEDDVSPIKRGLMLGILLGVACGAKLTAIGFVAVPLAVLALIRMAPRQWPAFAGGVLLAGLVAGAPYLARNAIHLGNPFFPFLTELFGTAHWSSEQAAIWQNGHVSNAGIVERLQALWHQWLRFGIGPNPDPAEPWLAQWSIMPWLGVIGLLLGTLNRSDSLRRWSH